MRLWQKFFLLTLFLAILAVNSVSCIPMIRGHKNSLVLAKEKAQAVCEAVISELEKCIQNEKEQTGYFLLTDQEIEKLLSEKIKEMASDYEIEVIPITLKYDSANLLPTSANHFQTTFLNDSKEKSFIQVDTTVFWEGHFYRITVTSDISNLFVQFSNDLFFSQWFGIVVSLCMAIALLMASLILTRPLESLESMTKRIANGEYQNRIAIKGNDEITELSEHMNTMSAKIEANIRRMEEISQSRETFIANMAHELKTPLTSILGFADILKIKSNITEEEYREYGAIIAAEAKRLKLLSQKLMELISLRETELQLQPVNLKELLEKAIEVFSPICEEHQCFLQFCMESVMVDADSILFTSLILNLLDNARKASSPGQSIEILLEKENDKAVLRIQDFGIGIPQEQLAHVTEAFYMVDKARSRNAGGAGIGLSLCKAITEAHHGSFKIESKEKCGTKVLLIFPISKEGSII